MDYNDYNNNNPSTEQNQNLITDQNQFPSEAEIYNNQTPNYNPPPDDTYNQPAMPPVNPPIQYPPPQPPHSIYQQLNIPNPLSENNINSSSPQTNAYTASSGIYDYQSNIPPPNIIPNIPNPQSIKEIPLEVQPANNISLPQQQAPVEKPLLLQTDEQYVNKKSNSVQVSTCCCRDCCEACCACLGECCEGCCKCFEECLACECCDEQCCQNCTEFTECCLAVCQICVLCLSCLEIFAH